MRQIVSDGNKRFVVDTDKAVRIATCNGETLYICNNKSWFFIQREGTVVLTSLEKAEIWLALYNDVDLYEKYFGKLEEI